jgi:beta-glucanase (GH16 family)
MNELSRYTNLPKGRLKLALAIAAALFFSCLLTARAQTLVWQDNFDSPVINGNSWTYDFGDGCERALCGWGNSELEYYTSRQENVRVENGSLIIEARKEIFGNSAFTSGRIKTEGRIHFTYGTIEARIKVPDIKNGLWPALWTLGTVGGVWPNIGEIDILEMGAQAALQANLANKRISGATHWDNAGTKDDTVAVYDNATDLSADYHVYKMVWTAQTITMFIDEIQYFSFDISNPNNSREEFHNPHFLLLNLAVGGAYTGIFNTNAITAPLPGKMYVDFVKLYQNSGDELYIGTDYAPAGNFGVLTETTTVTDSLHFGTDATLYYWNNLTNITNPAPTPFEGNSLLAVRAAANDWFGMGIDNRYVNLTNFATGSLKFHFKTTYAGQFKIGIKTGHGETWMNFAAGTQKYGLVRDGSWHEISIPLADFSNPDLGMNIDLFSIKSAFMFAGDPAAGNADFFFDDIYYSGGVSPNPPPTVAIDAPLNNAIINTPANITINATAADENGTVTKVDFYSGSTLLGTDNTSPYSYTWNSVTAGIDTLTAKATDNEGAVTTSAAVIIFVAAPGNIAPTTSISLPANNATYLTPAAITINATATDGDGSIYTVAFYNGNVLLHTATSSPYTYTWTGATAGNYALTVKATDNGGLTTTSDIINITVSDPVVPEVSITSPATNSSFSPPATITINATATDANGTITKVDFYNGGILLGTDNTSPYSLIWSNVTLGNYTLTAKATDNDNNVSTSTPVAISVKPVACTGVAVSGDYSYEVYTASGTVYYTFHPLAPIAGSSSAIIYVREGAGSGAYPGYNMTASGADFTFSKSISDGTLTSFYFSYNVPSGGERNSSADPHSYITGTVCVAGAPTVSITSPAEAASFTAPASITINANASDADGSITKVDFYNGATLIGTDVTSPYSFTWTNVTAGNYALTAKATDNSSLATSSIPVNIIVNAPNTDGYCGTAFSGDYEYKAETAGGIVTFTFHPLAPIAGCAYALIYVREGLTGGYPGYSMTASGSDFIFTKTIANATPISFYFTYNIPTGGERNSSANPHSYIVGDNCTGITGTPPSVSITSPANNAIYTEPATITINANATDVDGTISKVEFYSGATLLGTDVSSPYSFTWTNVPAGNYVITAKATDNSAFTTISSIVNVVVNINNEAGFCGTVDNGDYSYKVTTVGENVVFQFHPLSPIQGCSYVYIYVREGLTGGYPGYAMTAIGADFTFIKAIANGTPLSIYFTYNVPSGGERNSSATPHSYTVGTICSGLLPVNLLQYAAALQSNGTVAITWTTTAEINNDHFIIEKSVNGNQFTLLANVAARNATANMASYSLTDQQPVNGLNYYRLTQVDKDGRFTIYGVKTVQVQGKNAGIIVYPNPVKGNIVQVVLPTNAVQALKVQLLNITGKLVYSGKLLPTANTLQLSLSAKPAAGVYMLSVEGYSPVKLIVE